MKSIVKNIMTLVIAGATIVALRQVWNTYQLLFWSLVVGLGSVLTLGLVQRVFHKPEPVELPGEEDPGVGDTAGFVKIAFTTALGLLGLYFVQCSASAIFTGQRGECLGWLMLAALAWRPVLKGHLPVLSTRVTAVLLLMVLVLGGAFRFYQVGEVPRGMVLPDEPRIKINAQRILGGDRPTLIPDFRDAVFPYYMQALSMKLFGTTVTGFRTLGAFTGLLVVLLVFFFGNLIAGRWMGLASALLAASSVWLTAISRGHYLVGETVLVSVACLVFYFLAVKRDNAFWAVVSGIFFGLCFNVYFSALIMVVLMPFLFILTFLFEEQRRAAVRRVVVPFLCGGAIALTPLVTWLMVDWPMHSTFYFGPLTGGHTMGTTADPSFLGKVNVILDRPFQTYKAVLDIFVTRGNYAPWYLPTDMPVVEKKLVFLFIAGMAAAIVRFRRVGLAFLIFWWLAGLMPGFSSVEGTDRRLVMAIVPMYFLGGLGLISIGEVVFQPLRSRGRLWLAAGVALFLTVSMVRGNWNNYFHVRAKDPASQHYNQVNTTVALRALRAEVEKKPAEIVASYNPSYHITTAILMDIPLQYLQQDPLYFGSEGLFGALERAAVRLRTSKNESGSRDVLVMLFPFHFYLEPLLVNSLGGELVKDVPVVRDVNGQVQWAGGYSHPSLSAKIIRLGNFDEKILAGLRQSRSLPYSVSNVSSPVAQDSREVLSGQTNYRPHLERAFDGFQKDPKSWSVLKSAEFSVPDPWIWTRLGNLAPGVWAPFKVEASWIMTIPEDGEYSFGAVPSSGLVEVFVDKQRVYAFLPDGQKAEKTGELVFLKKGEHRFDFHQLILNQVVVMQRLQILWKPPGSKEEQTLPIELLSAGTGKSLKK